jgi:hypothetical protein
MPVDDDIGQVGDRVEWRKFLILGVVADDRPAIRLDALDRPFGQLALRKEFVQGELLDGAVGEEAVLEAIRKFVPAHIAVFFQEALAVFATQTFETLRGEVGAGERGNRVLDAVEVTPEDGSGSFLVVRLVGPGVEQGAGRVAGIRDGFPGRLEVDVFVERCRGDACRDGVELVALATKRDIILCDEERNLVGLGICHDRVELVDERLHRVLHRPDDGGMERRPWAERVVRAALRERAGVGMEGAAVHADDADLACGGCLAYGDGHLAGAIFGAVRVGRFKFLHVGPEGFLFFVFHGYVSFSFSLNLFSRSRIASNRASDRFSNWSKSVGTMSRFSQSCLV